MKRYKYGEWDIKNDSGLYGGWDDRTYIDCNGNPITGILEGFYGYTANTEDEQNSQYVENGKRKIVTGRAFVEGADFLKQH